MGIHLISDQAGVVFEPAELQAALDRLWHTGLVIIPPVNQGSPRPKLLHSIAEERGQLYARSSLEVSMTGNPFEGIDEVVIDDEGNLHPVRE